jgi:hypothetical protein
MSDLLKGSIIASAVAGLFGCSHQAPKADMPSAGGGTVHCMGINACKGQGKCHSADHGCAGMNECKGKGWIEVAEAECKAKNGTVVP